MNLQRRTFRRTPIGLLLIVTILGMGWAIWGAFVVQAEEPRPTLTAPQAFEAIQAMYLEEPMEVPDFTLPAVHGENVTLSSLQGNVVFLNFWATWCPYCRGERASLQALHEKYKAHAFEILSVSIDRGGIDTVKDYVEENKLSFLNVHDRTSTVASEYGVRGVPSTLFLNAQGKVVGGVIGPREWNSDAVYVVVEYLLAQQ